MKKRAIGIYLIFIILISPSLISAANETGYEKAYACLESKLGENCGASISTEQLAFSLMAGAYKSSLKSNCRDALINNEKDNCFGSTNTASCDVKSTAQAILALSYIGSDVDDYVEWILSKKRLTTNLNWFLEIDTNEAANCKIKINGENEKTFSIGENKKISGSSSCLTTGENGYFLKISESCYNKNFSISCTKDFITTLMYKKSGSSVYYVSSSTHSAPSEGTTEESITSFCFGLNNCDYEGSLWATIALAKAGEEVSSYLPYLNSMYDEPDNLKLFPSAFLFMLTGEDDYYSEVVEKQKQGKFWEEGPNKYYDTALALLSLKDLTIEEVGNAKDYLLQIQDTSGCWHSSNIRDTALILYAAWPKESAGPEPPSRSDCKEYKYFCVSPSECTIADTLDNFYCPGLSEICCKVEPEEQTCEEKGGKICSEVEECTGIEGISSDTEKCCMASCVETKPQVTECETNEFTCKLSCDEDEEEKDFECGFGETCCGAKPPETKIGWWIIILLIILIILVILAIIFRNQLRVWWFKIQSNLKFKRGPEPTRRPPTGPGPPIFTRPMPPQSRPMPQQMRGAPIQQRPIPGRQPIRQPMPPPQSQPPRRGPGRPSKPEEEKDKDFEETMKKLREMSK
jgi:hypothetical protein